MNLKRFMKSSKLGQSEINMWAVIMISNTGVHSAYTFDNEEEARENFNLRVDFYGSSHIIHLLKIEKTFHPTQPEPMAYPDLRGSYGNIHH